ncbi:histidine kinase [Actinoplanes sp. NPDC048791]|uniref:histidine kinase n=1 Tax=Actinoplanes sp. NPDC048791 TaxID=3154623 RepID=UPI0033FA6D3E
MNLRKVTAQQVAEQAGLSGEQMAALLSDGGAPVPDEVFSACAAALRVEPGQLSTNTEPDLTVVLQSAQELRDTCRPIQRDGIHFYNYYSMAAPAGRVSPVILDILCPSGRLPALNNGHLEPAITVNLGPGDIHGRWGENLSEATWQVLEANRDTDRWITGDSYVEPSYCPHSYSLAGAEAARIVSYTGQSNLVPLVEELNTWSEPAFANFLDALPERTEPAALLELLLARRCYDTAGAAAAAGITEAGVKQILTDPFGSLPEMRALGSALGFDYRLLLPPERRHDPVGKTWTSVAEGRRTQRDFRGYRVASMASAPHLSDLSGTFLQVETAAGEHGGDLVEANESHYLVISGAPALSWQDQHGAWQSAGLEVDASAWAGPFVRHRWSGTGSVLRFGSGSRAGYLDLFELTNTFAVAATARRSRRDTRGWGYDS